MKHCMVLNLVHSSQCRSTLPKAREQQASSSSGSTTEQQLQLPTGMPRSLPGMRVVSAEQQKPDQGGMFKDTGLTRTRDTGGVGDAPLISCTAVKPELLELHLS